MNTEALSTLPYPPNNFVDALLDETRALVLLTTVESSLVMINQRAALSFGIPREEAAGRRLDGLLDRESRSRLVTVVSLLDIDGETASTRLGVIDFTGVRRFYSATIRHVVRDEGHARYLLFVLRESKPATDDPFAQINAGHLIKRLLKGLSDSVLLIDYEDRTICDCNPAAELMFGYSRKELIGRSAQFLTPAGETVQSYANRIRVSYAQAGFFQDRMRCRRKDGSHFMTIATNIALFDSMGEPRFILAINRDITCEERRLEDMLNLAEQAGLLLRMLAEHGPSPAERISSESLHDLGFSPRQIDIAVLLAAGSPTKAIAAQLAISESAVKSHLSAMYRRVQVSSRIEFVKRLHDRGIRMA